MNPGESSLTLADMAVIGVGAAVFVAALCFVVWFVAKLGELRLAREQAAERAERRARRLAAEERARRTPQVDWARELQLARAARDRRAA